MDRWPSPEHAEELTEPEEELARLGLVSAEEYELADPIVLRQLIGAGHQNVAELAHVRDELAAFIRAHCTLEDLLSVRG